MRSRAPDVTRQPVLGVKVSVCDYTSAVKAVIDAAQARRRLTVSALAVHGVMTGALDREHRARLNALDLVVPDGQPVRWALNGLHRAGLRDRVYGPELMLRIAAQACRARYPVFLYGSTSDVLDKLQANLVTRFPGLVICGARPSQFRRLSVEERDVLANEIRASGARITFVGLGCPRQEAWTYEHRELLDMPIVAVGAAFDFHAGTMPQAPAMMQATGLEWAFRLFHEPRRLWRRYVLLNPLYVALVVMQRLGTVRFDACSQTTPGELRFG